MDCAFLLSTCDSYEDTWDPFFRLLGKYWTSIPMKVYINTETKQYVPSVTLPFKVNPCNTSSNISWSQRLLQVLDMIPEEYVFMVLDDFFLQSPVKDEYFEQLLKMMEEDRNIASIQLKAARLIQEGKIKTACTSNLVISEIDKSGWKTHFVPTIWRKSVLKKWLRKHETIWGFEIYGSQRARIWNYKEKVLAVDSPVIFDYLWIDGCSVIVNGKWLVSSEVDNFFPQNGIDVDLNKRGRITLEEYRSRTLKYTISKLTFGQFVRKCFNRIRSIF